MDKLKQGHQIGVKISEKAKQKMSETRKKLMASGKIKPINFWKGKKRLNVSNENHWAWKGDNVRYSALHTWVKRHLGKPDWCEYCGKTGLKGAKINWANKNHKYLRNINDWMRLCAKCHAKYDIKNKLRDFSKK